MKENKSKIIIVVTILGVLLLLVGGITILTNSNDDTENKNPKPTPTEDTQEEDIELPEGMKLIYSCQKQPNSTTDENTKINQTIEESYVFYVTESNNVQSGGYNVKYTFATLEDLNGQYDYLANKLNLKNSLTKDETNLTVTYKNLMVMGGVTTFDETYLDDLTNNGYTCKNIEG